MGKLTRRQIERDVAEVLSSEQPVDVRHFAEIVRAEMPYVLAERGASGGARGRFGDRKVFVAALWRLLRTHPRLRSLGEARFKQRLFAAHRAQLLTLARADLVAAMDPEEVAASEVGVDGATFHFVVDE